MALDDDVLEQLRQRLAHLEARQRATGSTAEPGLWSRLTSGGERKDPSKPAARARGRARRAAPPTRPGRRRAGPWGDVAPERLQSLDLSAVRWLSESDMEDGGWLAAVEERAEAAYAAEPGHGVDVAAGAGTAPEPPVDQAEPDVAPGEPAADPGELGTDAAGPGADPGELGTNAAGPGADPGELGTDAAGPGAGGAGSRADSSEPAAAQGADHPTAVLAEAVIGMSLHRHQEAELGLAAEWIAAQRASHDVMLVGVLAELEARGAESPDGLSRADWLRSVDPTLNGGAARAFVRVAAAISQPKWHELRILVTTQQVTVLQAAQIVEFEERTSPVADRDELDSALADVVSQATTLRDEELRTLIRHHTEQVRPPKDDAAIDEGRRQARGLWFGQPNATGMVAMRATLDPEAAAVLKSAVDPLSLPCPTKDQHGHLVAPDPRSPAKRRADALLEIVARGVSAPDGVPTTDKAKVVVLIDHETLVGQVRGTGQTLSGDVLSPEAVRRMACDASIIPVVLGGQSEPLDVGRERRLVTKGLRLALIARDQGCSFPGCTMPPQWTDAHHVVHWAKGGHTSLLTTALLCRRHHTHVHRHDLTASVTAAGVTWHV